MEKFINDFTRYYNDRYENGWKVFEQSKPDDRQGSTNHMIGDQIFFPETPDRVD